MKIRSALPMLGLMVPMIAGCDTGGVWANVPDDPGPIAAQCRREAADSPEYRYYGEISGGNAANEEEQRQRLLILLPQLYHDCMVRNGAASPPPRDRVTF